MTEAAVACAGAANIKEAGVSYAKAFSSLLEALRVK
jgi:hypothetical protein